MNGLPLKTRQADVFQLLTDLAQKGGHPYDYIILDPPAFTKSSSTVKNAYRGYKQINYRAMKLLPRGGYLATCSCSHFMTAGLFLQLLREAAAHPILWGVPETEYLKFLLFQVA